MEEDFDRKITELCLSACRKRKSPQTGLIHFCYEARYEKRQDTIPLKENWSFALALLRSKLQENVLEAKEIIEKLLHFEVEGNFPVYLHHAQECVFRSQGIYSAVYIFWILKDFQKILGEALKEKLKKCLERCASIEREKLTPGAICIAEALKGSSYFEEREELSPIEAADRLMAWQILGISEGEKITQYWDENLGVYTRKSTLSWEGFEPEIFLRDFFMGKLSSRLLKDHPIHMLLSCVQRSPSQERVSCPECGENTLTILSEEKGKFFSFYLESTGKLAWKKEGKILIVDIFLENPLEASDDLTTEIRGYFTKDSLNHLYVDGKKGTIFSLENELEIKTEAQSLKISPISLIEGEGRFTGYTLFGNRPMQRANKGENLYKAFDQVIGWRTMGRSASVQLQMRIDLSELSAGSLVM